MFIAAKDIHLPANLRSSVGERFTHDCCLELRSSTKAGNERVGLGRRYALRNFTRPHVPIPACFLPFLERKGPIDTRSVALRRIERMYEPASTRWGQDQAGEPIASLTWGNKFLDPDVFSGGENAVIAENEVSPLAVLGDDRLKSKLRQVAHSHADG